MKCYETIYKCRLCQKLIHNNIVEQAIVMRYAVDIAVDGNDKRYTRLRYIAHFCDDGSVGVADFLGFRKVE